MKIVNAIKPKCMLKFEELKFGDVFRFKEQEYIRVHDGEVNISNFHWSDNLKKADSVMLLTATLTIED